VGSLSSELAAFAEQHADRPRVYADANIPAGVVSFMRNRLRWDVLFVVEHDDLRRAHDGEHYRLAREMRRTLVTLDRDYTDDRRFPPADSGGVIIASAPDERALVKILRRIDRLIFRNRNGCPLAGRKLQADVVWPRS
jgi:hypothetical protein